MFTVTATWLDKFSTPKGGYTDRQTNITNEIRRQVQVYLENPIEGW